MIILADKIYPLLFASYICVEAGWSPRIYFMGNLPDIYNKQDAVTLYNQTPVSI